jgi:hypothetical protein
VSEHNHREYVKGCLWCELSHDEVVRAHVRSALALAWESGYLRGTLDTTSDPEPADNPYKR